MDDGQFQWDDDKAASNFAKHGVRFEVARDVLKDPFAIEFVDDRKDYGEDRFLLIGMAGRRLLVVVYMNESRAHSPDLGARGATLRTTAVP